MYDLDVAADAASTEVEEYTEEHAAEDGLLWEAVDGNKVGKKSATGRLKEAKKEADADPNELAALAHVISLLNTESATKKEAKDARAALGVATLAHYGQLSETDVREVVLDCKWHPSIGAGVGAELSSLVASLVDRIEELRRRYETTVGSLEAGLAETSERVDSHLAALGVV